MKKKPHYCSFCKKEDRVAMKMKLKKSDTFFDIDGRWDSLPYWHKFYICENCFDTVVKFCNGVHK